MSKFIEYYPTLVCGISCTFIIDSNRNLLSFGKNDNGKLGVDESIIDYIKQPNLISSLINIKIVCCGNGHTVCINYTGDVFTFGCNTDGKLGINDDRIKQTYIPQKVNIEPIKQISCGKYHTICLSFNGDVYSFGKNNDGVLGHGDYISCLSSPKIIKNLNNIVYIESGGSHVISCTNSGNYYVWGANIDGQLGLGNYTNYNTPIKVNNNWPDNIISIKCDYHHSILLVDIGNVYTFGSNFCGQVCVNSNIPSLNKPTLVQNLPEIKRIECGFQHSVFIDIENTMWVCGHNTYGQLGLEITNSIYKPIKNGIRNIIDISSSGVHTFIKNINNEIYSFGDNDFSQLGERLIKNAQPQRVFINNEDIWINNFGKSRQKSARK